MELGLRGKRAIVTGGTRGIGRRIVECLLAEGVRVALCARNKAEVEDTIAILSKAGDVTGAALDVADHARLQGWIAQAAASMGGLDILVANVSAGGGMEDEKWRQNFEIDLMASVRAVQAAEPALVAAKGSVVFIGTTAAVETFLAPMPYNALKAALVTYGKQLAEAWAPQGVRVNTVSPGPVYFEGGAWAVIRQQAPQLYEQILAQCPTGRMTTPEEVANAVAFLASKAAGHITGVNLIVDGGFTRRVQF